MNMIGERIALLREKMGMTQEELSKKIDISRASLCHYEKSRREPDYETLMKIADLFRVSADYLMGRTNDPHQTLDPNIRSFVDQLELSDELLVDKFALMVDGTKLSFEEAKRFIAFVRAERAIR
ncbi:helix-turn-helix domain-containing protein [Paenibacillus puerhi]|uniref:helix-turn-helix domain-containing protein n=1 Tax=Paenibacillus puerhi TaxID=2692622 RepID=UPI00135A79CC|nr:helix-turn-helix transcriptional regulator [Paenibacillus puerhi]